MVTSEDAKDRCVRVGSGASSEDRRTAQALEVMAHDEWARTWRDGKIVSRGPFARKRWRVVEIVQKAS